MSRRKTRAYTTSGVRVEGRHRQHISNWDNPTTLRSSPVNRRHSSICCGKQSATRKRNTTRPTIGKLAWCGIPSTKLLR